MAQTVMGLRAIFSWRYPVGAMAGDALRARRARLPASVGAGLVPARIAAGDDASSSFARSGQPQGLPLQLNAIEHRSRQQGLSLFLQERLSQALPIRQAACGLLRRPAL